MANIFGWLKPVGSFLKRAVGLVQTYVTDENIEVALKLVALASDKFDTNEERREFVVSMMVKRGIPENLARVAVELAVLVWKKGREKS